MLWTLEFSRYWEKFFGIIVFQFVGHLLNDSMVGLMVTYSKKTSVTCRASQVCCSQSPCPCNRPLFTRASAGDTQTLKGRSGSVSCGVPGSWCAQVFVWALWASLVGMRFDSQCNFAPPTVLLGFSFALQCGVSFLAGSNIPLWMVVQWLVTILEFLQEKISAHPLTPHGIHTHTHTHTHTHICSFLKMNYPGLLNYFWSYKNDID